MVLTIYFCRHFANDWKHAAILLAQYIAHSEFISQILKTPASCDESSELRLQKTLLHRANLVAASKFASG
jgi:hypothetical protein